MLWFFSRKTKQQRLQKKYRKDTMMSNHFCEKWLIFSRKNASSCGNYLVLWLAVNRTWIKRGCEQVISFILRRITTLLCQIKHDQEEKGSSSWFLLEGLKNGKKNSLKLLKLYKFPWKTAADINCLVLKQLFHDCHRRNLKRINFFLPFFVKLPRPWSVKKRWYFLKK